MGRQRNRLVALGGALFGAFPKAYATILSELYVPVMLLIASLIMRGAAIEFRHAAQRSRTAWDRVFGAGSLLAAIAQGIVLGKVLTGFVPGAASIGFVIITAIGVVSGYALLGATAGQEDHRRHGKRGPALHRDGAGHHGRGGAGGVVRDPALQPVGATRWQDAGCSTCWRHSRWSPHGLRLRALRGGGAGRARPFAGATVLFIASFAGRR